MGCFRSEMAVRRIWKEVFGFCRIHYCWVGCCCICWERTKDAYTGSRSGLGSSSRRGLSLLESPQRTRVSRPPVACDRMGYCSLIYGCRSESLGL